MSETLSLSEIKAHLSEVVDRVEGEHQRVYLTRNGRPAAVILSPDDLAAIEDTLEILSNPEMLQEIRDAQRELSEGEGISGADLAAKYLRR